MANSFFDLDISFEDEETPDIYILIMIMREVIGKYLPKDE